MQFSDFQIPEKSRFTKTCIFQEFQILTQIQLSSFKCLHWKIVPTIQTRTPISQLRKYIAGQSFGFETKLKCSQFCHTPICKAMLRGSPDSSLYGLFGLLIAGHGRELFIIREHPASCPYHITEIEKNKVFPTIFDGV